MTEAAHRHTPTAEQAAVTGAPADKDLLIVAGAGSGKTATMTRRIVDLIARGVPPERILGLTFTRKAASELLARVSHAVPRAGADGSARADRIFLKPEVHTYDAFFQSIVRQYGALVGFGQSTQPISDAGAHQLAADVVGDGLPLLLPADGTSFTDSSFAAVVQAVLDLAHACSSAMISPRTPGFADAVALIRRWDQTFSARLDELIGERQIPTRRPSPAKLRSPRRAVRDSDQRYAAKLQAMRDNRLALRLFHADRLRTVTRRRETLLTLAERYQRAKREANMAEFEDFTVAAYQLLMRFPSIGAQYRRCFSHVFLDEYQDTSTTQAMLLAALFHPRRDRPGGDRTAITAVGDPFQSIYAWRGASPGAFRTFQRFFGGGTPYTLSRSFRNSRIVLDAANRLTVPLRNGGAATGEVAVRQLVARAEADPGTLALLGYRTLGQEVDGTVRFARRAAALYGRADAAGVDAGAPHVAVLFRSKQNMPEFRRALEDAGMSCEVVGYSALLDTPEARDVLAVLRVIGDHTDSGSLMSLLASPRFAVPPRDLDALARLAGALNTRRSYAALAQAGVVPAGLPASRQPEAVAAHRDEVPTGVFLADVLLDDGLDGLLRARGSRISPRGRRLIGEAAHVLRRVQHEASSPLRQVMRAAIQALDLDIDTVVAEAIRHPSGPVRASEATAGLRALERLTEDYIAELSQGGRPTLRGFTTWVDAMRQSPEEPARRGDAHADVTLMTIHQAKGLEWDAVAVVGLTQTGFPSSQGDNLRVAAACGTDGRIVYQATAHTWLDRPQAIPAPVRADAPILPPFPHDVAADAASAVGSLAGLTLSAVEDEAVGELRAADPSTGGPYPTQRQAYGERLHAGERRLAYVALTRARHDALLTFSASSGDLHAALDEKAVSVEKSASIFWRELRDAVVDRPDAVTVPSSPASVVGCLAGEHAADYRRAVVDAAVREAGAATGANAAGQARLWPIAMDSPAYRALRASARLAVGAPANQTGPLSRRVDMVLRVNGSRLGLPRTSDESVRARAVGRVGARILAEHAQNVTAIQARQPTSAGGADPKESLRFWRGVVRPVPHVASPDAEAGTLFHAWASRFLTPLHTAPDEADGLEFASDADADADPASVRAGMIKEVDNRELRTRELDTGERQLLVWQRRLINSRWTRRRALWTERPIVANVNGSILTGKLDAVFAGGLNPADPAARLTVIDWKTGGAPRAPEDRERRLIQLDLYRLLLAMMEAMPLDAIDAALYYVSEADPARRQIDARHKSREEILDLIDRGLGEQPVEG